MFGRITGETIKSAVAIRIKNYFAFEGMPQPKIYKEKLVQRMAKPCFFIWVMDVSQEKTGANTFSRNYQINIRFHLPENTDKEYEVFAEVGNKLLEILATIDLEIVDDVLGNVLKPVRGKQMSFNIQDGVLQLFVTYAIRAKQFTDGEKPPKMQEALINKI